MAEEVNRKPHVRPMTAEWIFRHPRYLRYMVREFSCLFIGAWTLMLVCALARLSEGPQAWAAFLEGLQNPLIVAFHVVALAFAFYHSVTWFNLTPKALPLQVGEEFVPDAAIAGAHFAVWAGVTVAVLYLSGAF
jgi:succinate dehydrogenase subunit C